MMESLKKVDWPFAALALIYALFVIVGSGYIHDSQLMSIKSPRLLLLAVISTAVLSLFFYLLCIFIRRIIAKTQDRDGAFSLVGTQQKHDAAYVAPRLQVKLVLQIAAILVVAWLPWAISAYPGYLDEDTVFQLAMSQGFMETSDHHPFFDTLIFGLFYNLGETVLGTATRGVFLYTLVQLVLIALSFSLLLAYLRSRGIPRRLFVAFVIIAGVFPLYPLTASYMSKDMLFTVIWIPFLIIYVEAAISKGQALRQPSVLILFTALLVLASLTKKTGPVIVVLSLIVLCIFCKNNRARIATCFLAFALVFFLGWQGLVLNAAGIGRGASREILALPMQQLSRAVANNSGALNATDREALNRYFQGYDIGELYIPNYVDHVKERLDEDELSRDPWGFARLYLDVGLKNPSIYLSAVANHTVGLYFPSGDAMDTLNYNNSFTTNAHFLSLYENFANVHNGQWSSDFTHDDFIVFVEQFAQGDERIKQQRTELVEGLSRVPLLSTLMSPAVTGTWLLAFVIVCALRLPKGQRAALLVAAVPFMLFWLAIAVGPAMFTRYFLALYFSAPLLCSFPFFGAVDRPGGVPVERNE
jgi:hypothetical protein